MGFTAKIVRKKHKQLPKSINGPRRVKVGFPAGAADAGNIQKAVWQEFGTRGGASGGGWGGPIPERPFMRNAVSGNSGKWKGMLRSSGAKILLGDAPMAGELSDLGAAGKSDIQAEIDALMSPPNAPATIALKGSSKPLIDTGAMKAAVTFEVE